ncbi:MAG: YncE family protein, partial [Candidatus Polarisedimenticolaceae bacterium]|nr:YncE family protein [Candidatus Polarisedimenticolaceae bacterium]
VGLSKCCRTIFNSCQAKKRFYPNFFTNIFPLNYCKFLTGHYCYGLDVFDTVSKELVTTLSGSRATSLALHPTSGLMYLGRWNSDLIEVIDTETYAVVASIPLALANESRLVRVKLSPATNKLYVTSGPSNAHNITTIDTATNTVIQTVPTPVAHGPNFVVGPTGSILYFYNYKDLVAVDATTMSPLQTANNIYGNRVAIDSSGERAYVKHHSGVYILDTNTMAVIDDVVVTDSSKYLYDMAIHPNGELAYLTGYGYVSGVGYQGVVFVVDLTTASLVDTAEFGSMFGQIVFGPGPEVVGGSVTGMTPTNVECHNNSTGQIVSISPIIEASWDCETAGLDVSSGDSISISVTGPAK